METLDEDYKYLSSETKDNIYADYCARSAITEKIDELIKEYEAKL